MASNWFAQRRAELGLTARELAAKINAARGRSDAEGLTGQAVSRWEMGGSVPRLTLAAALATAYQVTKAEILNHMEAAAQNIEQRRTAPPAVNTTHTRPKPRRKTNAAAAA